ncbi:hypothetical protein GQ457_03G021310 [Hibiscus cannabinus]
MEDTSAVIEQQKKCYNKDFTGRPITEMPNYFTNNATDANEHETFPKEMRCPYKISLKLNYLTSGNRLHGAIPIILWKCVHITCCRLCIQVGRSNNRNTQ